ncbi:uncharacterized protein PRD47_001457 isoform 1-T1 [Ara ararauna]
MEPVPALTRVFSVTQVDPEDLGKESAGVLLPDAGGHKAETGSLAEHNGNGVLPAAGAQQEEDYDSWCDSEVDPEDLGKESAGVLLPDAGGHKAETGSLAEHNGNGVLPAAREEKDFDSLLEPVTESKNAKSVSAIASRPAGSRLRVGAKSVLDNCFKGNFLMV